MTITAPFEGVATLLANVGAMICGRHHRRCPWCSFRRTIIAPDPACSESSGVAGVGETVDVRVAVAQPDISRTRGEARREVTTAC